MNVGQPKMIDCVFFRNYYDTLELKAKKQKQLRKCKFFGLYTTPAAAIVFMAGYWAIGMSNYLRDWADHLGLQIDFIISNLYQCE